MKYLVLFAILASVCSAATVLHAGPKVTADGSCVARCGDNDPTLSCQCNSDCTSFNDCCADYSTVCYSCTDRCGEAYSFTNPCVCSDGCEDFNDCCSDYSVVCQGGVTSGPGSCAGRCDDPFDSTQSCQCNSPCVSNGDCCSDYDSLCSGGSGSVTDQDILDFTEQIFTIGQPDFVGNLIVIDQTPPGPLFISVDEAAFNSDTMQTFLTLRQFYQDDSCTAEDISTEYVAAKDAFLDACMATDVMNATEVFLQTNGLLSGPLRDFIDTSFFDMYTRCSPAEGSSGFEHSFIGEIDDNEVKGFHNWISFYLDEQVGQIDYTDYLNDLYVSPELSVFMMGFDWYSYTKPISSMWIGSTPEMELSLYAVSFLYQSNSLVDVSMNGALYRIQTYTQNYNSEVLVGSAYPDID